jgi:hypothetical protein
MYDVSVMFIATKFIIYRSTLYIHVYLCEQYGTNKKYMQLIQFAPNLPSPFLNHRAGAQQEPWCLRAEHWILTAFKANTGYWI